MFGYITPKMRYRLRDSAKVETAVKSAVYHGRRRGTDEIARAKRKGQKMKNDDEKKTARGVLIDPERQTVEVIDVQLERRDDGETSALRGMYDAIGCRGVDCIRDCFAAADDDIWIDDEGIDNPFGWSFAGALENGIRYGGRGLVMGVDLSTGATTDCTLSAKSIEVLRDQIIWLNA